MSFSLSAAASRCVWVLTDLRVYVCVCVVRNWSEDQAAAGGWPPQQPVNLLASPAPVSSLEVSRQLYAYLETPTAWCRRLQVLGGSCSAGSVSGLSLLCRDDTYAPQSGECIVYTFNVAGEWSFARDAARHRCQVHAFDPSLSRTPPADKASAGVQFHQLGLAGSAGRTESGAATATLTEVMKQLGHAGLVIDYLKVDVQGDEWDWLERDVASLADVRQLGMRVYLSLDSLPRYHRLLWRLHQQGLRLVYTAADSSTGRTWEVAGVDGKVAVVYDLLWINRRRCAAAFGCGG